MRGDEVDEFAERAAPGLPRIVKAAEGGLVGEAEGVDLGVAVGAGLDGVPRIFSSSQTPRLTGEVSTPLDVTVRTLACSRRPRRGNSAGRPAPTRGFGRGGLRLEEQVERRPRILQFRHGDPGARPRDGIAAAHAEAEGGEARQPAEVFVRELVDRLAAVLESGRLLAPHAAEKGMHAVMAALHAGMLELGEHGQSVAPAFPGA